MVNVTLPYEKSLVIYRLYATYSRGSAIQECFFSDKGMQAVLRPPLQ